MRAVIPSAGRVLFCGNELNANTLTRIGSKVTCTRASLNNTISYLRRGKRCVSHRTAVLATNHEAITFMSYRPRNSINGKDDNSAGCKMDIGGGAKSQPRNRAMIRNFTMLTAPNPLLNTCLDTLSRKTIQSRQNSNLSNGDKRSENTKPTDDDQENAKQSKAYGMISKQTADQISSILNQAQSIPNIITIMRICSTPFLSYFILTEQYTYALTGCVLAAISDGLDGYIARNYDGITVLGTYLDPLADKIFINCLALTLSSVGVLPTWCVGIWIGKDVLLMLGTYFVNASATIGTSHAVIDPTRTSLKIEPTFIGKVNAVLQFGTIGVGLGLTSIDIPSDDVVHVLSLISCGTTIASGLSYIGGKSMTPSGNSMVNTTKNNDK